MRQPRVRVVEPDDEDAARADEASDRGEGPAWIRGVVQHPARVHDVESAASQARNAQVGFDEERALDTETLPRGLRQLERSTREIRADDDPVGAGEEERHLSGAAAQLEDAGVARNRTIEEARELAPSGSGAQPGMTVSRRVRREGRLLIELPYRFGPPVRG